MVKVIIKSQINKYLEMEGSIIISIGRDGSACLGLSLHGPAHHHRSSRRAIYALNNVNACHRRT
jgi:hypothetical protein